MSVANLFNFAGPWLKTALHVHTDLSDGAVTTAQAFDAYRAAGYQVVALTDHWKVNPATDPAGELLTIPGCEYDAKIPGDLGVYHIVGIGMEIGSQEDLKPLRDNHERLIEALQARCRFLAVAHPYWSTNTCEQASHVGEIGCLEVFNYGCQEEAALGYSTYPWDQLLTRGQRWNAIAVDDAHWRIPDSCGGWVMVQSERTAAGVIAALRAGRYYSSSGAEIHAIRITGRTVEVECSPASAVLFRSDRKSSCYYRAQPGQTMTSARHELRDTAQFVRVEVVGPDGKKAWSNPFYFEP